MSNITNGTGAPGTAPSSSTLSSSSSSSGPRSILTSSVSSWSETEIDAYWISHNLQHLGPPNRDTLLKLQIERISQLKHMQRQQQQQPNATPSNDQNNTNQGNTTAYVPQ